MSALSIVLIIVIVIAVVAVGGTTLGIAGRRRKLRERFGPEYDRVIAERQSRRLGEAEYLAGDEYTIADMATWPWYGALAKGVLYEGGEFLSVQDYKNVQRWTDQIGARPTVKRGRMVNCAWGDPPNQLHERHDASDFELRTQDKLAPAES